MFTKKLSILEIFAKRPWDGRTFREIKESSGNKSDNYVFETLKRYVSLSVLEEKKYGNSVVYFPAHGEAAARFFAIAAENAAQTAKHLPHRNIEALIRKVPSHFFSLIVTGSYASGKQTPRSDLDVIVICGNGTDTRRILVSLKNAGELQIPEVHPYVFTEAEFLEMLTNKEENYGKEAARNCMVVSGGEAFYRILFEAVDRGFKG